MKRVTRGLNGVRDVNFDVLSFILGKRGDGGPIRDIVSYLMGKLVGFITEVVNDVYEELRSAPIHTSITIDGNVYPRMDNTRLGLETIKGRTVAMNQLVQNGDFADGSGWDVFLCTKSVSNNICTITVTEAVERPRIYRVISIPSTHVCFITAQMKPSYTGRVVCGGEVAATANVWKNCAIIFKMSASNTSYQLQYGAVGADCAVNDTVQIANVGLIDLTLDYGSTIADSIYAMEQATPGAGVAYVRERLPLDYYAFNAGELKAPSVSGVEVTGFNAWDEEWEVGGFNADGTKNSATGQIRSKNYIPVLPNTSYYGRPNSYMRKYYYDASKTFLGRSSYNDTNPFTTPNDCYFIMFEFSAVYGTTYKNDICINLSDPSRNGEYRPYQHESLSIPSTTLNGVGTAQDYIEAVEVGENDYSLIKTAKILEIDLGSINWSLADGVFYSTSVPNKARVNQGVLCAKYANPYTTNTSLVNMSDKTIQNRSDTDELYIKDSAYSDTASFKTAMSGVTLAYEAATPTQTTIAEHLTLAEVSLLAENGGIIGIVNANGDIVQPDLTVTTVINKSAITN